MEHVIECVSHSYISSQNMLPYERQLTESVQNPKPNELNDHCLQYVDRNISMYVIHKLKYTVLGTI